MPSIDLEAGLSDEERAVRETVHAFAEEVMRPAGAQLDARASMIGDGCNEVLGLAAAAEL